MTLAECATFVCNKVGQADTTSVALCKSFAKARDRMIFDAQLWNDSVALVTGLSADTTGVIGYPNGIDRVISIRAAGRDMLFPTDASYLMQVDPQMFERTGTPIAFEDFTDTDNGDARKLRLFPIPNSTTTILLRGKRSYRVLADDSSVPMIRGTDNAWVSYVQGDMYQRQRQMGKAQACFQEAGAHLDLLRRIETEQAGSFKRVVPWTEDGSFDSADCDWLFQTTPPTLTMISETGTASLNATDDFVDVVFGTVRGFLNYYPELQILYPTDPPPEKLWVTTIVRSLTGFRVYFNTTPPDTLYTMRWEA